MIQLSFPDSGESSASPEIGFTATKKIGNAVIRNRCRRRLRALCDLIIPEFSLQGTKFVLIARSGLQDCDFAQISRDLRWALRRLNAPQRKMPQKTVATGNSA